MPTATLPRRQVEATARRPPAWLESSPPWLQDLWRRQVAAHMSGGQTPLPTRKETQPLSSATDTARLAADPAAGRLGSSEGQAPGREASYV